MPRTPAGVTQADIARAIRAVKAAGLPVVRVVVRPDGVAVETTETVERDAANPWDHPVAQGEPLVLL